MHKYTDTQAGTVIYDLVVTFAQIFSGSRNKQMAKKNSSFCSQLLSKTSKPSRHINRD